MRRNDPQQREVADGAILRIDYRIGVGIVCARALGDEGSKISRIGERTIGRDVGPDMIVAREIPPIDQTNGRAAVSPNDRNGPST
jgi:hypothetical protein